MSKGGEELEALLRDVRERMNDGRLFGVVTREVFDGRTISVDVDSFVRGAMDRFAPQECPLCKRQIRYGEGVSDDRGRLHRECADPFNGGPIT